MKQFNQEALRKIRIEKSLTVEAISKSLGVTKQALSSWETGATEPSLANTVTLSKYFGVPIVFFINDTGNISHSPNHDHIADTSKMVGAKKTKSEAA